MVRLLVIIVMLALCLIASYLHKHSSSFAQVLAGDKPQEPIITAFKQFAKMSWLLFLLGSFPLISGQKMLALLYIALIMLASTVFSLKLAKLLS